MKVKEIRELTTAEMLDQEKQLKEELFNLRFQLATGQLENTARIKEVRKSIAKFTKVAWYPTRWIKQSLLSLKLRKTTLSTANV